MFVINRFKNYLNKKFICASGIFCGLKSQENCKLAAKMYFLVCKKKPVDFDDELKIGDVRYDNMTKITIKVQLF